MASDSELIKGAGQVAYGAAASIKAGGAGADMLFNVSSNMQANELAETKQETKEAKVRKLDMDGKLYEVMESVNASSQTLSEQHYNKVKGAVEGLKMDYDACNLKDDACRREVMSKMNAQTTRMDQQKELRDGNKKAYNEGLLSGQLTDAEKNIMAIYMDPNGSEYELDYDKDPLEGGEGVYKIANPNYDENLPEDDKNSKTLEYTESEITSMFDKQIDVSGKDATSKYGLSVQQDGLDGKEYNSNKTIAKFNELVTDKNISSFTHDDMGFGSFKEDMMTAGGPLDQALLAAAKDPTNDYGITPGEGDGDGPWYTNIDANDRAMMFDALTNKDRTIIDPVTGEETKAYDPKLHKDIIVNYMDKMSKKNFDDGKKTRENEIARKQNEANEKARLSKLKFDRDVYKKNMPGKAEKELMATGAQISNIMSLDAAGIEANIMKFDGLPLATKGDYDNPTAYVRGTLEGGFILYAGDPDAGGTVVSELSSDPSIMKQEMFNHLGISMKYDVSKKNKANDIYNKYNKSSKTTPPVEEKSTIEKVLEKGSTGVDKKDVKSPTEGLSVDEMIKLGFSRKNAEIEFKKNNPTD